jgi:hypothetical protein
MNSVRLLLIAVLCGTVLTLASCNKLSGALKKVEGKVAGQVMNDAGVGRGYVTVKLEPTDPAAGDAIPTTTEDSGSFMFDTVPPGEYVMKVYIGQGTQTELPSDTPTVNVAPGRTVMQNIMLKAAPTQ